MKLQVTYDKKADAFALNCQRVNQGHADLWEAYPWVLLEVDEETGDLLCVEILGAAKILGDLLSPLNTEEDFVCLEIEGDLSAIKDALLQPDGHVEDGYKEYIMFSPGEESAKDARLKQVRDALAPYLLLTLVSQPAQA